MKNGSGKQKSKKSNGAAMRPFSRSLPMQLMRAREAVMRRFRPHLAAHGFSDQQWRIIRALADAGGMEIGALAEQCQIHPASLSRMLPKLVRAGYVSRRNHKQDQRRVVVSITPRGRALFRTVAPESEEIYAAMERDIGAQKLRDLYRLLDELIETLPGR
ncbi:MAG: homoprotocatechuate degradation operon regulator HpaR [Bradyrhizobiaceae bacterium]|nr:homoprotocatechuate degradation operon regulator HpaR [Bradyrhizobiaceae bacterium]